MRSLGRLVQCRRSLCRVQRPRLEAQDQPGKTEPRLWPLPHGALIFTKSHLDGVQLGTWLEGAPSQEGLGWGASDL